MSEVDRMNLIDARHYFKGQAIRAVDYVSAGGVEPDNVDLEAHAATLAALLVKAAKLLSASMGNGMYYPAPAYQSLSRIANDVVVVAEAAGLVRLRPLEAAGALQNDEH